MTETGAKPRRRKLWKYLLLGSLILLLALGGLAWYATTESFQAMVRGRLVAELERMTGGRVELGSIHTIPFRFRVEIRDLTIHGREQAGEVPYVHVDRLLARVKIISVLGAQFGFDSLVLERPVIHFIRYPDGSTNQPEPRLKAGSDKGPVEQLFSFSVNRLEVRRGGVFWNDQQIPLDFVVHDVSLDMRYSFLHRRYEGNLLLGKVDTRFDGYRPLAWMAETHFTLSRDRLEVASLKATSGRSRLQASGRVADFDQPKIEATYDVTLDLAEAAAIARRQDVRGGVLQLVGQGSWSAQDFSSSGKLLLKDFGWRSESVKLQNAALNTQFAVTRQRLTLSQIQARLLGGGVTGDADITNWLSSSSRTAKGKKSGEQQGTVRLAIKNFSAGEMAAAVSTRRWPLNRLNLAGSANGTIQARWKGAPRDAEAAITLDVVAPEQPASGQLPLNARFRGTYRGAGEELEVTELTAATRATQIHASGLLSSSAAVRFSLNSTDLQEWQPVLDVFGNGQRIPVVLHGRAVFMGTATGKLSEVTIAGNLRAENFDTLIPATSHTSERRIHWDVLDSGLQVSPHSFAAHNGILRHGNAVIRFDLSAGLHQGQFTEKSPMTARVGVRDTEVGEILALAGYQYPVSGIMNLQFEAEGTRAEPHGEGRVELTKATIYGEPVEHFTAGLRFARGELQLNNIQLAYYDARVNGAAAYNPSARAFHFDLTGANFDLARIPRLQTGRLKIEGRMDFSAQGSGTLDQPVVNAALRLRDLTFDHERAGDFTIDAATKGADLHLTGRSQFEQAELTVDGNVHLRGDWPATAILRFNHLDVDPLLQTYLKGSVTGHSAAAGEVRLEGPLRRPRDLAITANLSDFSADIENIKVHNDGPVRFSVLGQVLKVDQFRLVGEGTDLSASGSVGLVGERELEARAQGTVNLKLIESYNPSLTASGVVKVDMTASGSVSQPVIQGRLQVSNGALAHADLPSGLSDINGSLVFNQNRLQIETLTAHTGGGLVTLGGSATYNRQLNFDLTIQGQDVRLRYPPGVSSTANADLRFTGSTTSSTLSGDITITKLAMTPGFDFGSYLARSAQSSTLPQTNPLLNRIRLDVHVVTTPELQMRTAVARLSGDADLHLRGSAAKPVLLGRVDIIEGEVYFNGAKYRLERGDVSFLNPAITKPVLDLQMTTRVRDYDITVNLNGDPSKLNVNYRSEPPLPAADIVALLALGRTREESAQLQQSGQSPFSQEASNAILAEALNSTVSNRVQRLFGVSRLKIDPQGMSTETNPARGPQVTIEQQVADDLTLTYSQNVSQASQQIIQVEYNVSRNVSIVAIRDQNGVVSFDVRIRQRKK